MASACGGSLALMDAGTRVGKHWTYLLIIIIKSISKLLITGLTIALIYVYVLMHFNHVAQQCKEYFYVLL